MSKIAIEWNKDKGTGDVLGQVDMVGPSGHPMSVAARANAVALTLPLVKKYLPTLAKLGHGALDVKWSKDPATGDLVGQITFTGPDGKPATLSARANEAIIRSTLLTRYAPHLAAVQGVGGNIVDEISDAVAAIARTHILAAIDKGARDQLLKASLPAGSSLAVPSAAPTGIEPYARMLQAAVPTATAGADISSFVAEIMKNPISAGVLEVAATALLGPAAAPLLPALLAVSSRALKQAADNNPAALSYVARTVDQASKGDIKAMHMVNIFKALNEPTGADDAVAQPAQPPAPTAPYPSPSYDYLAAVTPQSSTAAGYIPQATYYAIAGASMSNPPFGNMSVLPGNMTLGEIYAIAGADALPTLYSLSGLAPELYAISGAGAPPTEERLAENLISKAEGGDMKALQFLGLIAQRAKGGDQPAVRMQTVISHAAHTLKARKDAAAKAAAAKASAAAAQAQALEPVEGGPISSGNAVAWNGVHGVPDPALGITISGLAAYVPPTEQDLRNSKTMAYALQVMKQSALGNAKSKLLISTLRTRHTHGDPSASALLWFLHQAWLMLGSQGSQGAAAGDSAAYGDNAWNAAPMNVQNYYQISGENLGPFYGAGAEVVSPDAQVDIIIGAGGKTLKKAWNGKQWVWVEANAPVFASKAGFGMRDAMLHGRQAMQRRQLRA